MCNIRIINIKKDKGPYDIYIGRENKWLGMEGSKWGNPFHLKREVDRPEVLRKYREYILSRPDLIAALPELKDKILGCFCFPKKCHGDVLMELLKDFYGE